MDEGFDVRFNIKNNLSFGVQLSYAVMVKIREDVLSFNTSCLAVSDYYFYSDESTGKLAPFVGLGLGGFLILNSGTLKYDISNEYDNSSVDSYKLKPAALLRAGFEYGRFRLSAEYHYIPKSKSYNRYHQFVRYVKNGYFGLSLGFYIGGTSWGQR